MNLIKRAVEEAAFIEGWMQLDELQFLAERAAGRQTIVEFGCHKGRSTKAMGIATEGLVFAVDPWRDIGSLAEFMVNLRPQIGHGRVRPQRVASTDYVHKGPPVDMVFIDADHGYECVVKDIKVARRLLEPGTLLCGHDYKKDHPGVMQAVNEHVPKFWLVNSIWWSIV